VTIREVLLEATHRLELQRISNPRLCAEVLLAHFLKTDRTYLYAHDDREISSDDYAALENAIYERIGGVPVQYIVGHQEFYGRDFIVNPSVLIPRPETEYIIAAVLESHPAPNSRIIDVGTGSGCIAITLALELPEARVWASDISETALKTGRLNAVNLEAPVDFVCTDVLDGISGEFDFVVSNPPYVRRGELHYLQREVREHEPHVALFSPEDELEIYHRLVHQSLVLLKPSGRLVMEIGFAMEQSVLSLFSADWTSLPTKTDLQGIPRTIIAEKATVSGSTLLQ
jgi:release factor glutamine methyltransferase